MFYKNSFKGITLSEVCLVLGIIGLLFAISTPIFVANTKNKEYETKYKKAYVNISQAWLDLYTRNQIMERETLTTNAANQDHFDKLKAKFSLLKECTSNNNSDCWASGETLGAGAFPTAGADAFIDTSGISWSRMCDSSACGGYILVDVNSIESPNTYGVDRFILIPSSDLNYDTKQIPSKIMPIPNYVGTDVDFCPSGSCYYTSLLE